MIFEKGDKLVFIGDSITADGCAQDPEGIGLGYVRIIHDFIKARYPELGIQIINKGIGGDRVTDLHLRWKKDVILEKPDWISISIGINDVWHQFTDTNSIKISPGHFEMIYRELLLSLKEKTDAKIIMMEPSIIGEDIHSNENLLLKKYVEITRRLSSDFNTLLIPIHHVFQSYLIKNPHIKLTTDGVHMNSTGRMLMALTWLENLGIIPEKRSFTLS